MKKIIIFTFFFINFLLLTAVHSKEIPLSEESEVCIDCHSQHTPGIVEDWHKSRHSQITPEKAEKKSKLEKRISSKSVSEKLKKVAVGCYECHGQNPSKHKDNFEHFGFKINTVVSPNDCNICHPLEVKEFSKSKKAHALSNLKQNPVYHTLVETIISVKQIKNNKINHLKSSKYTERETCYACHGAEITVNGMKTVSKGDWGEIKVPNLINWPNMGVGRKNPDGSLGACTSCHPRHSFSIEIARKPYTCAQCHVGPDVPAWNVYKESKHGNIFLSENNKWNWDNVPWKIGKDFKTPTCSVCHNSLITNSDNEIIVERTHDFGSRLWVRIFGLIYSHPQPKNGKTHLIKNKDGLSLPTTFTGELASNYLIDKQEQHKRRNKMGKICQSCHSRSWVNQYFKKMDNTLIETDKMVFAATQLLLKAWDKNLADKSNPFDEIIEQKWVKQWLFYANSIRYGSAMGGADFATFENGWWYLTNNLQEMHKTIKVMSELQSTKK